MKSEHRAATRRVFGRVVGGNGWELDGVVSHMKVRRETVVQGYARDNRAVVPCEDLCQSDGSARKGKRDARFQRSLKPFTTAHWALA